MSQPMYSAQNLTTKMQLLYVAETKKLTIGAETSRLVDELFVGARVPNPTNIDAFDNGRGDALGNMALSEAAATELLKRYTPVARLDNDSSVPGEASRM